MVIGHLVRKKDTLCLVAVLLWFAVFVPTMSVLLCATVLKCITPQHFSHVYDFLRANCFYLFGAPGGLALGVFSDYVTDRRKRRVLAGSLGLVEPVAAGLRASPAEAEEARKLLDRMMGRNLRKILFMVEKFHRIPGTENILWIVGRLDQAWELLDDMGKELDASRIAHGAAWYRGPETRQIRKLRFQLNRHSNLMAMYMLRSAVVLTDYLSCMHNSCRQASYRVIRKITVAYRPDEFRDDANSVDALISGIIRRYRRKKGAPRPADPKVKVKIKNRGDGLYWLNRCIVPYRIPSAEDWQSLLQDPQAIACVDAILSRYKVQSIDQLRVSQLQELSATYEGRLLKRLILEEVFPLMTPDRWRYPIRDGNEEGEIWIDSYIWHTSNGWQVTRRGSAIPPSFDKDDYARQLFTIITTPNYPSEQLVHFYWALASDGSQSLPTRPGAYHGEIMGDYRWNGATGRHWEYIGPEFVAGDIDIDQFSADLDVQEPIAAFIKRLIPGVEELFEYDLIRAFNELLQYRFIPREASAYCAEKGVDLETLLDAKAIKLLREQSLLGGEEFARLVRYIVEGIYPQVIRRSDKRSGDSVVAG